jgi:hypothetical protein
VGSLVKLIDVLEGSVVGTARGSFSDWAAGQTVTLEMISFDDGDLDLRGPHRMACPAVELHAGATVHHAQHDLPVRVGEVRQRGLDTG